MKWIKDYKKIPYPVGWLSPDGEWFLLDDSLGRAYHFKAAHELVLEKNCKAYGHNAENMLENEGYVKVRKNEIRYLANWPREGFYDEIDPHTPDITEKQQKSLYDYMKWAFKEFNSIDINGNTIMCDLRNYQGGCFFQKITFEQFKQMDKFALRKLFGYD